MARIVEPLRQRKVPAGPSTGVARVSAVHSPEGARQSRAEMHWQALASEVFNPRVARAQQSLLAPPVALRVLWGAHQVLGVAPQAERSQAEATLQAAHWQRAERERQRVAHWQRAERSPWVAAKRQGAHQQLAEAKPPAAHRQRVARWQQVA